MKLVLIEWLDSHMNHDSGWRPLTEIAENTEALHCRSVGWLLSESKTAKTIVPHTYGQKNENIIHQGCGEMTIPNRAILKMTVLRQR